MIETGKAGMALVLATCGLAGWACNLAAAAVHIEGQVQAGGGPLANSVVTFMGSKCRRSEATGSNTNRHRRDVRCSPVRDRTEDIHEATRRATSGHKGRDVANFPAGTACQRAQ